MNRRAFVDRLAALLGGSAASFVPSDAGTRPPASEQVRSTDFHVRSYGARGDDATDDAAAIQAAVDAAHAARHGGTVVLDEASYLCRRAITLQPNVSLRGRGMYASTLRFSGETDGVVLRAPRFDTLARSIEDVQIAGAYGRSRIGLDLQNVAQLRLRQVFVSGFTVHGIRCRDFDHVVLDGVQLGGNGRGTPNVCFDTTAAVRGVSNGILARDVWLSGGNVSASCGVQIDRTTMVTWVGGTIESSGVGLRLGATNSGDDGRWVSQATFIGTDFENCRGRYVEIGTAWKGRGSAVYGAHFLNCSGSLSGSTQTPVGFSIANCVDFEARGHFFVLSRPGAALFDFVGDANATFALSPASNYGLAGGEYLRIGGVAQSNVRPGDAVTAGRSVFVDLGGGGALLQDARSARGHRLQGGD